MLVSTIVYCIRRSLEIYNIAQLVVNLGTRLVITKEKNLQKVLRHFSLVPRLQHVFVSQENSFDTI